MNENNAPTTMYSDLPQFYYERMSQKFLFYASDRAMRDLVVCPDLTFEKLKAYWTPRAYSNND